MSCQGLLDPERQDPVKKTCQPWLLESFEIGIGPPQTITIMYIQTQNNTAIKYYIFLFYNI